MALLRDESGAIGGELYLSGSQSSRVTAKDLGLSPRQADVFALLLKGLPNKLIARTLTISESTTKVHVSAVLRALKVTNRTNAVIAASRLGVRLDWQSARNGNGEQP